ncbi:ZIP family metal transporter [Pseudogemmatithrix spongiicola]|uniref:ZIP family metal transporter n=1 Tax=Pseudogemmatithrix spongiicola TaxID=3062599 RepID=A0AA49JW24_9BACT|nr:ZIP family metal transporter [Gemmatimonadaceae bacterium 'strain 138']WKW15830.1 ZIP family metal transporter [Gemmatimonadaceae bacterium 'strain 318']
MTPWIPTFASLLAVTGVPLLVLAVLASTGRTLGRLLPTLVSFGAGALLGAAVFHLLPEAYERHPSVGFVALSVAAGVIGSYVVERWLHKVQHTAHEAAPREPALSAFDDPAMVAVSFGADAVHNFVDGALIAAAFLAGTGPGIATAIAMLAHELPREIGTFGVFVHYGTRPRRAVGYAFISGLLAFAGAALTLWFGEETAHAAEVVVPVAAGSFLFVGGAVMLSQLKAQRTWDLPRSQLAACALGFALSAAAALLSGGH